MREPRAIDREAEPPTPARGKERQSSARTRAFSLAPGCGILLRGAPGNQVLWWKPLLVLIVFAMTAAKFQPLVSMERKTTPAHRARRRSCEPQSS